MSEIITPDMTFIKSVMQNDRVWKWTGCDGVEKATIIPQPDEIYFQIAQLGYIMFREILPGVFEIHISMLKSPPDLPRFIHATLNVMRSNGAIKFIAPIGGWNRPALRLAETCGFIIEGEITRVYKRAGKLYSMVLWGSE
jgi:hypothetical protein